MPKITGISAQCLQELQQAYPNADIYLNGQLTIDFPEEVKIPIEPNQMVTASLVGSSVKFSYCGLDRAIALLKEQYAVGTVEVKIVQPHSSKIGNCSGVWGI